VPAIGQKRHGPVQLPRHDFNDHGDGRQRKNLNGTSLSFLVNEREVVGVLPLFKVVGVHLNSQNSPSRAERILGGTGEVNDRHPAGPDLGSAESAGSRAAVGSRTALGGTGPGEKGQHPLDIAALTLRAFQLAFFRAAPHQGFEAMITVRAAVLIYWHSETSQQFENSLSDDA
jgi:hypothetical protein